MATQGADLALCVDIPSEFQESIDDEKGNGNPRRQDIMDEVFDHLVRLSRELKVLQRVEEEEEAAKE